MDRILDRQSTDTITDAVELFGECEIEVMADSVFGGATVQIQTSPELREEAFSTVSYRHVIRRPTNRSVRRVGTYFLRLKVTGCTDNTDLSAVICQ